MEEIFTNSMNLAKKVCTEKLKSGSIAVDATMGKGNDTLFLAKIVGASGKVYAFDIQNYAIEKTYEKLQYYNLYDRVKLIKDGHENIEKHIKEKVDLVMFNLGYLPGVCHNITTKYETTLKAVKSSLNLIKEGGVVLIVVYYGHAEGKIEKEALDKFLPHINQKDFNIINLEFMNQINSPPTLICIEKRIK